MAPARIALPLVALALCPSPAWPEGFRLRLPLACEPGVTCFVQYIAGVFERSNINKYFSRLNR